MAAYALIETFLLREVLESGPDPLDPLIYFETRHQVQSLRFFDVGSPAREPQDTLDASRSTAREWCSSTR